MPADIRGFFGPKGGQTASKNQERTPAKTPTQPPTPSKDSRKRKSIDLDDDDDEDTVYPAARTKGSRKSRKIVEDILETAGADCTDDIEDDGESDISPSVVRRQWDEDDTF